MRIANDKYYDNLRGKVGEPILIETTYSSEGDLKVVYDINKYKEIKDRIVLCRYDDGKLVPVENTYISVNNEIIGPVYSGEYVLVDAKVLLQELNLFIK